MVLFKRLVTMLAILGLVVVGLFYYLFLYSGTPQSDGAFFDIDAGRAAAGRKGVLPVAINVEHISHSTFPEFSVVAGLSREPHRMDFYAFQVVYPDGSSIIIDTGMDETIQKALPFPEEFRPESYARVIAAMSRAKKIVLTHEDPDHIGGLTKHPDLEEVLAVTDLTEEQLSDPEDMEPAQFPEGALKGYLPLAYTNYHALAPGIALIKAPGHSPGSQLILVRLDNGEEFLFVGDIAWHRDNIELVRTRARYVSLFLLKEDPGAVLRQLATFRALKEQEPDLNFVIAHDGEQVNGYIQDGLIGARFE